MKLIESVPNVSEGRRPAVIARLADAVATVPGVALLNHSADVAHNRSVFTMAGRARDVADAVLRLAEVAIAEIDLRTHHGEHPRVGALDVVPFIPLEGSTMNECIELSKNVGRSLAARFNIPVFLYEESASRAERRRLEMIRRGQFEGLAAKMADAAWVPDFGPPHPHPTAGATVVGARRPLIAFNVNLETDRLDIAREVAAAVRESSGGLACVKALGLWLADRQLAQVSMNLTDYERTPIQSAYDAVERAAASRGVRVRESELIGLIPAAAMRTTTPEHLRLTGFTEDCILENRLRKMVI